MNKKGKLLPSNLGGWIIVIFALLIIVGVFFGFRGGLVGGSIKALELIGFGGSSLAEKPPESSVEEPIPPNLESKFTTLVTRLRGSKDSSSCLAHTGEMDFDDGWYIELTEGKAKLFKESDKGAIATGRKTEIIDEFKPCIIKGNSALNFYNCYLKPGAKTCNTIVPTYETVILTKNEKMNMLYKTDVNSFCYLLTYDDGNKECDIPKDKGSGLAIDNDCRFKMPYYSNKAEKIKSTCNDICEEDLSLCGETKKDLNCIAGVEDGDDHRACSRDFDFESDPLDDYCICGQSSEKRIPVPRDFSNSCNNECSKKNKECIISIDDGGRDVDKCAEITGFEGNDDYCVCGDDTSEKVPNPVSKLRTTCNIQCGELKCIMGIDDGDDYRECDHVFDFEGGEKDDYCICGDNSYTDVPEPSTKIKTTCDIRCGIGKCLIGIDDGKDYRKCDESFDFEKGEKDDYCICREDTEIVTPVPSNFKSSCNIICGGVFNCIRGITDGNSKACHVQIEFNYDDDYCLCGSNTENIYLTTYWKGQRP
jgi:hypothetical protein